MPLCALARRCQQPQCSLCALYYNFPLPPLPTSAPQLNKINTQNMALDAGCVSAPACMGSPTDPEPDHSG